MRAAREQGGRLRLAQLAALHEAEVLDEHALVLDAPAVGRHGAGRDAADVGVVGARGDEEEQGRRSAGAAAALRASAAPRRRASSPAPSANTGVTTVRSGRCVPPAYGELSR